MSENLLRNRKAGEVEVDRCSVEGRLPALFRSGIAEDLPEGVAQTYSLLYRRIPFCLTQDET